MKERYAKLLPLLRYVARIHGYALGLHGSGARDLDLIAVPWVEDAGPAEELVEAIRHAAGGFINRDTGTFPHPLHNPTPKPHGRQAWAIVLPGMEHDYLDLSVLPRAAPNPQVEIP